MLTSVRKVLKESIIIELGTTAGVLTEGFSSGRGAVLVAARLDGERRQRALAFCAAAGGTRARHSLHPRLLAHGLSLGS